jgi:hypothetical protein
VQLVLDAGQAAATNVCFTCQQAALVCTCNKVMGGPLEAWLMLVVAVLHYRTYLRRVTGGRWWLK